MKTNRKFITLLTVVMMLALIFTGCGGGSGSEDSEAAAGDEVTNWAFYSAYGPEDSACCRVWTQLFEDIEAETDGRLVITAYWDGQHPYAGEDMLKVVDENVAQLAHYYSGYVGSVDDVFNIECMPMLLPQDNIGSWKITSSLWGNFEQNKEGPLEAYLEDNWNATMVNMIPATSQRLMTKGYDGSTLDSLKGHKVRVYSTELAEFIKALGGTPVTISYSEVYTGLSTNLIDGVTSSVVSTYSGGWFDHVDHINTWEISASSDGLMCNLDALAALPDDVRETFLRLCRESAQKPEMMEIDENNAQVDALVKEGKAVVCNPSAEDREAVAAVMKEKLWDSWVANNGKTGEDIMAYITEME